MKTLRDYFPNTVVFCNIQSKYFKKVILILLYLYFNGRMVQNLLDYKIKIFISLFKMCSMYLF